MADHMPKLDWGQADLSNAFKLFRQRCELYFTIKDIKDDLAVSHILLAVGEEGLKRYNTWDLKDDEKKKPEVIWEKFQSQIDPAENFRICRLKLYHLRQNQGESIDDFVTRAKALAQKCDFSGNELNDRLIEIVIASTPIPEFQKELLGKPKDYTLDETLKLGRSYEATISHMNELHRMEDNTVSSTGISAVKYDNGKKTCPYCGLSHYPNRQKCPAFGTTCKACGKRNHWASVCKSKDTNPQNRGRQHYGNNSKGRYRSKSRKRYDDKRTNTKVNVVQQQDTHYQSDSDFETIMFSELKSDSERDEAFATLDIQLPSRSHIDNLKLKVDTGAQGNTLPIRIYRRMYPKLLDAEGNPSPTALQSNRKAKLTAYNGTEIRCYGCTTIPCRYQGNQWTDTEFFVVDVDGPAIVGLPSCQKLKLVTLNCVVNTSHTTSVPPGTTDLPPINNVEDLKRMYPDRFDTLGCFPGEVHLTVDPNVLPHIDAPRKVPIALKDEIQEGLQDMESLGVIRKVTEPTDWVSSLAYSRKSNGSLRICLDPRHLNKALKRPHHRIPTLDDLTYKFRGAKFFTKLDAKSGYWAARLDKESQLLTTFQTPFGRYCFCRLPFGLSVSQDVFQLKMDQILGQCDGAVGISDDCSVYGNTEQEHDANVHQLMRVARENGLVLNSDAHKCAVKQSSITFYGVIFSDKGVKPHPKKVEDVNNMPAPNSKKELQEFLGLVTYLSPFIPNLSDKAANLRNLLKKDAEFVWDANHDKCFAELKETITEDATLQYFDVQKTPTLQTDASQRGLGAALLQDRKPVAYASKSLSSTERNYACIERELLAIVFGIQRFHTYLYGRKFIVLTDHKPLEMIYLKPITSAPPRLQRMLLKIQGYDFELKYCPGKEMVVPDTLSRLPTDKDSSTIDLDIRVDLVQFSTQRIASLKHATNTDPVLTKLGQVIATGWPTSQKELSPELRQFWSFRDELSIENGLVLKSHRIVIPKSQRSVILEQLHYAHLGNEKTKLSARETVFWPNMNNDIERLVKQCGPCNENQCSQPHEKLRQHEIPSKPWEKVGGDLFHFDGHKWLLLADYYSKFPIVRKMPQQCTSPTVIAAMKQIFGEYGIPKTLFDDNGGHFISAEFQDFARTWGFDIDTSSPRYPRSNGFIERQVGIVKKLLTKAKDSHRDPELALLCLRNTPIDHKLPSPGEMLFGHKLRGILPSKISNTLPDCDKIKEQLTLRQSTQKKYHDRNAKDLSELKSGQCVRIQDHITKKWLPAIVQIRCTEPRSYIVETPNGAHLRRNRHQIRETLEQFPTPRLRPKVTFAEPQTTEKRTIQVAPEKEQLRQAHAASEYRTRSGRLVKKPDRYGQ